MAAVDRMTGLFEKPSVKSRLRMVVSKGTKLTVGDKKEDGDFEFGATPGGWALLKGDHELPSWTTGTYTPAKKSGGKKGGKIAGKGKLDFMLDFGANPDATKDNMKMTKTFTLETGIPERAWCKLNIKPGTVNGVYSGGLDKKGREIVYVLDHKFEDEFTLSITASRRVYSGSSSQVFNWESDLKISCVVMVPKEEVIVDDDDDDDDAGNLLGGSSDSDSDSDSDS